MATLPVQTLAQLRTSVAQRADIPEPDTATVVTKSECNEWINNSLFELRDLLVQHYGDSYFIATPHDFTTVAGTDLYALPADFYKLVGVDLLIGGLPTGWMTMRSFPFGERNRWSYPATTVQYGRTNLRYCIVGDDLMLRPFPQAGLTVRVHYIPRLTALSDDTDTTDGIGGWLEYVVVDAALKAMVKQERDPSALMAQKAALVARIEAAAANRDAGEPARITDSQGAAGWFGGGSYHGIWPGDGW